MFRILKFQARGCLLKQLCQSSSTSQVATQPANSSSLVKDPQLEQDKQAVVNKERGNLVSAAFEKLKSLGEPIDVKDAVTRMISEAQDIEQLLSVVTEKKITRNHALKILATISEWLSDKKIKSKQFEKDKRFLAVCQMLGSNPVRDKAGLDLNTVLDIASDDDAAKKICDISQEQRLKVLSTLASQKRRSTPMLRSLAHNIASGVEHLDIKQGADALYAVAMLNYHDELLLDKICSDLCLCLMTNSKRAVVGSIITSLGILRYKNIELLNLLCEWTQNHIEVCNSQDLASLVMTLAMLNHLPINQETLFPLIMQQLELGNLAGPLEWLDVVWALTVLNKQSAEHVSSVLSPDFQDKIETLSTGGLSIPTRLKLLNINGVAKFRLKDYKGPLLDLTQEQWKMALLRSKDKQALVSTMQETMLNLLPSAVYLNTNIDLGMGFLIDAECLMNAKLTPLPLFDKKTKAPIDRSSPDTQRGIKVAIMVLDYHDWTRGRREATGMNVLCQDLTRLNGYRIMLVDHMDFNPHHKLVNRVQYLSNQLKTAVGKS